MENLKRKNIENKAKKGDELLRDKLRKQKKRLAIISALGKEKPAKKVSPLDSKQISEFYKRNS
jgi:hypothetical protein